MNFDELPSTTVTSTFSKPITIESLQQTVETLRSEGYLPNKEEQQQFIAKGIALLSQAHKQGFLSEQEVIYLLRAIVTNEGFTVFSSQNLLSLPGHVDSSVKG